MSVLNTIISSPSGGRFDFDDGGTYCGGWQDGKAHGHGVCTGPKNVGEYSGSWNFGFEMSGVYKWTNGAVYEGRWQNGKRHGVGVEYNGKWIYKGEWSQGLKGRYGVKASSNSAVKYEGTWANGLQDGYGSETYSDGGYYQGQMCRGLRHGYGVRKSAPYGDSQLNNPSKNGPLVGGPATSSMLLHSNSLQSAGSAVDLNIIGSSNSAGTNNNNHHNDDDDSPKPEDGFKPNIDRTLVSKNGFVLVAKPLDVPMPPSSKLLGDSSSLSMKQGRRNSLTNKLATTSLLRGLRLRKQKSTSDMDIIGGGGGKSSSSKSTNQLVSNLSNNNNNNSDIDQPIVPFTLSPEELDITDPTTVETYTGEWKHDKRNGHGVCDRSDGLKYEGQWHNDMKCGYGVTTFKDGTKEEGKYKNNFLIADSKVKRLFHLGSSNIRQRIDEAVKMAQQAQVMALKKAEIADSRAATARDKADQAMTAAYEADRDSQIAYSVARQYSDSQQQQMEIQQQQQHHHHQDLSHDKQDANEKQFLRPIEPFNGRRGSFRGGSQPAGSEGSGGGGSTGASSNNYHTQPDRLHGISFGQQQQHPYQQHHHHQQYQQHPHHLHHQTSLAQRQSSDPFSDLFDHYKSSNGVALTSISAAAAMKTRRALSKQTSLDYAHQRASIPRQMGSSASQYGEQTNSGSPNEHPGRPASLFSMDQAEEQLGSRQTMTASPMGGLHQVHQEIQLQASMQRQLRHLVTSGEELQQQQLPQDQLLEPQQQQQHQHEAATVNSGQTPTNSSYLGAHSSAASHKTPSPNESIAPPPTVSSYMTRPPSSTDGNRQLSTGVPFANQRQPPSSYNPAAPYGSAVGGARQQQQQQQPYAHHQYNLNQSNARDVHSLADEQLYLADRRRLHEQLVDRTEYSNYDFTISSAPRPSQRCMRRTASLSRNSAAIPMLRSRSQAHETAPTTSSQADVHHSNHGRPPPANQWRRSQSPTTITMMSSSLATAANHQNQNQNQNLASITTSPASDFNQHQTTSGHSAAPTADLHPQQAAPNCNHQQQLAPADAHGGSMGALNRKPSLQVRYNLDQLGGLMSREEVAALSHSQREQRRLEAELAERRAKRPLLHLYLSLKELLIRHQLLLSVLFFNSWLLNMFINLMCS